MGTRRGFGYLRRLPSKRWQASYIGPDLVRHNAPDTFETKGDGEAWLAAERRLLAADDWQPPGQRRRRGLTFEAYAAAWLEARELKPSTRALYRGILARELIPAFGQTSVSRISAADVRAWYATLDPARKTRRAHAYSLLRAILDTAVTEEVIPANPCTIRGAGQTKRARRIEPATLDELADLVTAMPERLRLMPLIAAWCGLRFGEVSELRRRDLDLERGRLSVARGVVRVDGADVVGTPKSAAGVRVVAIPPHLVPVIAAHLAEHVGPGRDALLFPHSAEEPKRHMTHARYYGRFHMPAREAAGRPDLRFHDLRHTGATLAAQTGATLAELMGRLGHSTPGAALRYQHAAQGRDAEIARLLSVMAEPPKKRKGKGRKG
jgi:integrase